MDSDDEEMCDASPGGGAGEEEEEFEEGPVEAGEGVVVMDVAWFQVDLDYEFDAPRWFDLAQEEPPMEAAAAQAWFASAPSYPPSPLIAKMFAEDLGLQTVRSICSLTLIAKMFAEDLGLQTVRSIADTDAVQCSTTSYGCSSGAGQKMHRVQGRKPCNGASENQRRPGCRTTMKSTSLKGSTLMKPTASQLARQNRQVKSTNAMQSKKSIGVTSEISTISSNDCTYQSAKRQRLENGHLNKVDATANQHEFIHKNHEKNVMNRNMDHPTGPPKLKITIPREPELATKLRAERSRVLRSVPTNPKQLNPRAAPSASTAQVASTRKVVQPLRVTGHGHQHASRQRNHVGSNAPARTSNLARHVNNVDKKPEDCRDDMFKFKARPLDRKILASKGDVGVFRCAKKNTTVPKEFNLSTSRKGNPSPLSDLFNKLSLTTGAHQYRGTERQINGLPNYITTKDCKENMIGNVQC